MENTPEVHNLVVCTLCSCYPWPVLGLPPTWYKMPAYRSRAVSEPRAVLREFGVEVPAVARGARVGQQRRDALHGAARAPGGDRGLGEAELVPLVTRDALIGVAEVRVPGSPAAAPR